MPSTRIEIEHYVDEFLEVAKFQDVCLNGIQVEGKHKIQKIFTAVTASLFVIEQAKKLHADALFVHHGLFIKGMNLLLQGTLRKKIAILLENGINLFGYHLPLDAHKEVGNNWAAARHLGMSDLEPFGYYQGNFIGVKGDLPKLSRKTVLQRCQKLYGKPSGMVLGGKERVHSCALISGHAHKSIQEAIEEKLDCFITGTNDEPIWHLAREEKINFFSFGHAATERIGIELLGKHLAQRFNLEVRHINEPNPF